MYSKEILRQLPCYHCVHCKGNKDLKGLVFTKRFCQLTQKWGDMNSAFYCKKFKDKRQESSDYEVNGYRIRKDQLEDYRTENQWVEAGYRLKPGAQGRKMYATRMAAMHEGRVYTYYLPEQVEKRVRNEDTKICRNCGVREGRYCCVAGDYVKADHRCSEWMPKGGTGNDDN